MTVYRVEIGPRADATHAGGEGQMLAALREAGLGDITGLAASRLFFLEGALSRADAQRVAADLLGDPVVEDVTVLGVDDAQPQVASGMVAFEIHPRPGVMDPVAESTLAELRAEGLAVESVRTGRRFVVSGPLDESGVLDTAGRVLANDCIEQLIPGTAGVRPAPQPPAHEFELRHVPLLALGDDGLERLSRGAHLFLSLAEMRAIQAHFQGLDREPTDLELETLAQTWSEHCVHKTLRSAIVYRGAPLPTPDGATPSAAGAEETRHYDNLLKDTIVRATEELIAAGRGPQCLSIFKDNAGVIGFDEEFGLAFKVETHNHPSAIEPYGGAATGIGGVIRDIIGCGLGAKPVANTDVFCVAPSDWPQECLPKGVLHPWRVLKGIVSGVADYGNRMGIPTVNGAVYFDPRYLGNPLVYAGSLGLIPRDCIEKAAQVGDLVVVIGGRTGRDGIHGATFSSAELTDTHADEFSHAVQIGNAITEKRFLDAILKARDAEGGCLYTAMTDCGAGGLSSAVGEMGEEIGAEVDLDRVPLKYAGLGYDEIWISEAQERMVVSLPPANLERFLEIMRAEEVEATVIGTFGNADACGDGTARITLRFNGQVVGELDMQFLHHGVPRVERVAEWQPVPQSVNPACGGTARPSAATKLWHRLPACDSTGKMPVPQSPDTGETAVSVPAALSRLTAELARPNVASRAWIIRQYDHEVQGGSVVKPLLGPGRGPGDAAVLRPRLDSCRGVALGCGMGPHVADVDPYWMAAGSIDEAIRNVVCVGGDPDQTAILDNFCWGRGDDTRQLGALVRACQACYDTALAFGVPFISGKDSLNNEFALDEADVEPLCAALRSWATGDASEARRLRALLPTLEQRIRERRRLAIPSTLLISAISVIDDVTRCQTPDLKRPGNPVWLVGGLPVIGFSLADAARTHRAVAELIRRRLIAACHDVSDGGWLTAVAEMAFAGVRGVALRADDAEATPFEELCAAYVVEVADAEAAGALLDRETVRHTPLGDVTPDSRLVCGDCEVALADLRAAWARGSD